MDIETITNLISTLGFPIFCVIALGGFVVWLFKRSNDNITKNLEQMQENYRKREDKLYAELKENREINAEAIKTIAKYAERLEVIQTDIKEIKTDITVIMAKDR